MEAAEVSEASMASLRFVICCICLPIVQSGYRMAARCLRGGRAMAAKTPWESVRQLRRLAVQCK